MNKAEPRVILLHPMKTAGSALKVLLKRTGGVINIGHNINTDIKPEDFVILPVRNPYTRIHSMYYWLTIPRKKKPKRHMVKKSNIKSFEHFVLNYPPDWFIYRYGVADTALLNTCTDMITDLDRVDFICRFEYIDSDSDALMKKLGREGKIIPRNSNRRKPKFSMDLFTPEMLERVNDVFHDDFENFGYKKHKELKDE